MMTNDVKRIDNHIYECIDNQIGYIRQDNIVYDESENYLTIFAYFKEHGKGKITDEKLKQICGVKIVCGYYSYAQAPKEYTKRLGVTGTLETLHPKN